MVWVKSIDLEDEFVSADKSSYKLCVPDKSVDLLVPDIVAEYQQGGGNTCGLGKGLDQVPENHI